MSRLIIVFLAVFALIAHILPNAFAQERYNGALGNQDTTGRMDAPLFDNLFPKQRDDCKCGPLSLSCTEILGQPVCLCFKGSAEKNGVCVECDCGTTGDCSFDTGGNKVCNCKENYISKGGTCVEGTKKAFNPLIIVYVLVPIVIIIGIIVFIVIRKRSQSNPNNRRFGGIC